MKTRIIHTKIWQDGYFLDLTIKEKLVFLYLLSNERVNICGAYELPDRVITLETGLDLADWNKIAEKFSNAGKFVFFENWVFIPRAEKYNNYRFSEKNEVAYNRELDLMPDNIREHFGLEFTLADFKKKNYKKSSNSYQHTKIAEKLLGRKLKPNEVVHHLDKNPSNNNPANLIVMDKTSHKLFHEGKIKLSDISMILVSDKCDTLINHKSEIINKKSETINQKPLEELRKSLKEKGIIKRI